MSIRPILVCAFWLATLSARSNAADAESANYQADLKFLSAHTKVLELTDGESARIIVCPDWQARIMTSTCEGPQGMSFGWLNRSFIEAGKPSSEFNNYGGEDRFWLSPEAGQFAFFFTAGSKQHVSNWITPPGLNEGGYRLVSGPRDVGVRLNRRIQLSNYSGTKFDLDVTRTIKLQPVGQFEKLFGDEAGKPIRSGKVKLVGFESENTVANRGPEMKRATGLISIWTLGQFKPGAHTVIIVPYQPGDDDSLGAVVTPDYFANPPTDRLVVTSSAILFLGDGNFRAKIGISPKRARPMAGSYDFDNKVLTIVSYSLPDDAKNRMYINNRWELPQTVPYQGDVFNSYNDGPAEPGASTLGGFYELETLSPTLELAPQESLRHTHRTFHLRGDEQALANVAKLVLGVNLAEIRTAMFSKAE